LTDLLQKPMIINDMIVAAALSAALLGLMESDQQIAQCASETETTASAFVRKSFDFKQVKLYDGTRVTVAVANSACLAHNAVARVMIYAQTSSGYRLVLDDYSLPERVDVSAGGTATLASHESVTVVDQAAYVWNGKNYVFSPYRSTRYDVQIAQSRPYAIAVRFAPGTSATTLSGTVAGEFGDTYYFQARAGQRVAIALTRGARGGLTFSLFHESTELGPEGSRATTWTGTLPATGTYSLDVFGQPSDDPKIVPYALTLTLSSR